MKKTQTPEKYHSSIFDQNKKIGSIYILMANDDQTNCQLFKQAFEEMGLATSADILNNGQELMSMLTKNKITLPHIILLNLNNPCEDGISYLKEIKLQERYQDVTIGVYSSNNSEKSKIEFFLNGANVFIQRKDNLVELKHALKKVITSSIVYRNPPFNKNNFVMTV